MTVQELIEAARTSEITEERIQALIEVVNEAQERYEEADRRRRSIDWNFRYTL